MLNVGTGEDTRKLKVSGLCETAEEKRSVILQKLEGIMLQGKL
jgi:hypothetical protein